MKSLLLTGLGIYLLLCFGLFMLQKKLLYYPQQTSLTHTLPENIQATTIKTDGETLKGWVLNPNKEHALIYYGGNAESIEYNIPLFQKLNLDYSIYLIPYRGYGENSGSPSESALFHDALYIHDQLAPSHKTVSLMGRSLGSGVATHIAAQREIATLILVTPFDSIENVAKSFYWMFPVSWLMTEKYRSWENVKNIKANTTVLIAEKDGIIPRKNSDHLVNLFEEKNAHSYIIQNATHNDISFYPEFSLRLKQALDKTK